MRSLRTLLCSAALLASLAVGATADVRYTTVMSMGDDSDAKNVMTTTTSVKGMRERVDFKMQMGPMQMQRTTITMCDKHQMVSIDAAGKIYASGPIDPSAGIIPPMASKKGGQGHSTGTGQVVTTLTVKDLGAEKVGQFDTRHYAIDMAMQSSGCAGNDNSTYKSEVWVAPTKIVFNCPERNAQASQVVDNEGCKITYVMKGDIAKFNEIGNALTVKRIFFQPHGGRMTQTITDFSEAPQNAADFEVPADYKKVTSAEFEQAIMRSMMERMKNPPPEE